MTVRVNPESLLLRISHKKANEHSFLERICTHSVREKADFSLSTRASSIQSRYIKSTLRYLSSHAHAAAAAASAVTLQAAPPRHSVALAIRGAPHAAHAGCR